MKIAVYSAFYGGRDRLNRDCMAAAAGCDRFLFTDDPGLSLDGVTVVHDPLDGLDANRASRRAKLCPARHLPSYDWSLYLDNTATLLADPADLVAAHAAGGGGFFAFRHFLRDCAYAEAEACKLGQRDYPDVIDRQMRTYRRDGFPARAGLIAGTVLLRRHDAADWNRLGARWFEQVLRHSRRDQLAFPYIAWKMGLSPGHIDGDLRDNAWVRWPAIPAAERRSDFAGPRPPLAARALRRLQRALRP